MNTVVGYIGKRMEQHSRKKTLRALESVKEELKQRLLLRRLEQLSSSWLEFEIMEIDILLHFDKQFPDEFLTYKKIMELLSTMVISTIFQVDATDELHFKENSEKIKEMMRKVRNLNRVISARLECKLKEKYGHSDYIKKVLEPRLKQFEQNELTGSTITEWRLDKEKYWEQTNTDAEIRLREMECFVQKMTKQDCGSEFYQRNIVPLRHLIAKSFSDAVDDVSRSLITDGYRESMRALDERLRVVRNAFATDTVKEQGLDFGAVYDELLDIGDEIVNAYEGIRG